MSLDLVLYAAVRASAALTVLLVAAAMLLSGGWEAAVAALAIIAGMGGILSLIALLVAGEGTSDPTRP
jgi:H+/gluconate symporter-like permease